MGIIKIDSVPKEVTLAPAKKTETSPADTRFIKEIDYSKAADPAEVLGRSMVTPKKAERLTVDSLKQKLEQSSLPNMMDELIDKSPEYKEIWQKIAELLPDYAKAESSDDQKLVPFMDVLAPLMDDYSETNIDNLDTVLQKIQAIQRNRDSYSCKINSSISSDTIEKVLEKSFDNLDFSSKESSYAILRNIAEVQDKALKERLLKRFNEKIS